jgi:hypothetical protein
MARRAAAGFLVVLVCLLVPFAVAGLWGRDRILDTEGWADLAAELPGDEAARDAVAAEITDVVLDSIGVGERVRRQAEPVVHEAADRALATDTFAVVWTEANRQVHASLIRALEADEGSEVRLDLRPAVALVLDAVEEPLAPVAPLPGDVPEFSSAPTPAEAETAIETALGGPLAEDRATLVVIRDDRIATARSVYRSVDRGAFLLAIATALLAALAIALATNRWTTAAAVGIGSAATLLLGWLASIGVGSVVGGFVGEGIGRSVADAAAGVAADDLGRRYVVSAIVFGVAGLVCAIVGVARSRAT